TVWGRGFLYIQNLWYRSGLLTGGPILYKLWEVQKAFSSKVSSKISRTCSGRNGFFFSGNNLVL
ncbi:MAG: hypothetical protein QXR65_09200, partial [Candidatus Bathyarchaeia archaeon]